MKKVYNLSNLPASGCLGIHHNQIAKLETVEDDKKPDIKEDSTNNFQQYRVVTVPMHKIKILSLKKTEIPCQTSVKLPNLSGCSGPNLTYNMLSVSNSSVAVDKEVKNNVSSSLPADSIAKKFQNEMGCKVEMDPDTQLISPSSRWLSQPRSYRGAKKDYSQRKVLRKISVSSFVDTTDGETSGMGSSVDEPVESSTESASETSSSFLQPRLSSRPLSISPSAVKKRRGGWPKGRKRKPEPPGTKPPKAPLTAYVLFLNERRKFYKDTHPHLPFVEVTKLLGAEWSSMTQAQKAVYMTRSEQDKKRYRNELQTYRQSHDYQILLRKKRIKNAISRGQTTEESSDFTDEVDDDDSEELHCRTCDQWFSSLHNKREHLYGKLHLQAITGEYQRERDAEEERRTSTPPIEDLHLSISKQERIPEMRKKNDENEDEPIKLDGCSSRRDSIGVASTTEDDRDDDDDVDGDVDDEEEDDTEYDYDEATEEEGNIDVSKESCGSCSSFNERVTDAAEEVISKVLNREMEIRFLRNRYERSRRNQRHIYATLATLQTKQKLLQEQQLKLLQEEKNLIEQAKNLAKISEFCKNEIRFCNSERENDSGNEGRKKWSMNSNNDPFLSGKFTTKCDYSNLFLPPNLTLPSTSRAVNNSNALLVSAKRDNVLVFCNQEFNDSVKYTQFPPDLKSVENINKIQVEKDITIIEDTSTRVGRKPLYELYEYQNNTTTHIENNNSVTSEQVVTAEHSTLSCVSPCNSTDGRKSEFDHSYSKVNLTSLNKKEHSVHKRMCDDVVVNRNLHLDVFERTKGKKCSNELLKVADSYDCIEIIEPPVVTLCHSNNIAVDLLQANSSQSYLQQNATPTVAKIDFKRTTSSTNFKHTFHSIKEEPPNIFISPKLSESYDLCHSISLINSDDINCSRNGIGNRDHFYFSTEISPLEESSGLECYINNFIGEEIGYTDSVSKLLTISDDDIPWEEPSTSQKFSHYTLNSLPSLDNIFDDDDDDDSVGNILSKTS